MDNSSTIWDDFTNMYSLSKTLRFELRPVGQTLEHIKEKGLIEEDKEREKEFNEVKKIIDEYYKYFIEESLREVNIERNDLEEYQGSYNKLKKPEGKYDENLKKKYSEMQTKLRKKIFSKIKEHENYKHLFGKELILSVLPEWLEKNNNLEKIDKVKRFSRWATYFKGFFDNRENVFSEKDISTSIIFRIVNDNLPKFLDDISRFQKLKEFEGFSYKEVEEGFSKELEGVDLESFFSLNNFNNCLNQSGIERFNLLIGGRSNENGTRTRGLNELINEFSPQRNENGKQIRRLKLMPLFKQILSDREKSSFIPEKFMNDKEVIDSMKEFYNDLDENIFNQIRNVVTQMHDKELKQIYFRNDRNLTDISNKMFDDWETIKNGLNEFAKLELGYTEKKAEEWIKKQKYFSVYEIEEGIKKLNIESVSSEHTLCDYFSKMNVDDKDIIEEIKTKYSVVNELSIPADKSLANESDEKNIEKIKDFLDSALILLHFLKPLYVESGRKEEEKLEQALELDTDFYHDFNQIYEKAKAVIPLHNKVRNYITQKSFSTNKFKLNFQNSTLIDGWDENKIKDNFTVILRKYSNPKKSYDYFLSIMTPEDKKIFDNTARSSSVFYERMIYRQIADASKDIQNLMVINNKTVCKKGRKDDDGINRRLEEIKNEHLPEEINEIRKKKSYLKSSENFSIEDKNKFIGYYIERAKSYWGFDFDFEDPSQYADFNGFTSHLDSMGYNISFEMVDNNHINKLVNEGRLYLFQIWNKDFSEYSKGRPNLHTIYWRMLFDENNLKNVVFKLNGKAELFYREKSISRNVTHPKNKPIKNKDPLDDKKESKFEYDLIKDRRYTEDKFLFHCPITINFKSSDKSWEINNQIRKKVKEKSDEVFVLGIDRGERHLAYYTLLDPQGNIILQKSFNIISDDKERKRDYHEKLDKLEGSRDEARKNWKKIANIREMKEGYLAQVIHEICKLVIEKNAIIVLEDLNYGFKRGRFRIEKQVYQKFEKMLIDKLNFLMFKERNTDDIGGSLKAYQLTKKFDTFQKLGKQSGIIFYVPASYTSKICPATGFVNLLHPKYENPKKSKDFFGKFKQIRYNPDEDLFEFNFNYLDFIEKSKTKLKKDNWSVYSFGKRLVNRRKKESRGFETEEINLTSEFKKIFTEKNIEFKDGKNLVESIRSCDDADFFKKMLNLLKITLQLRNSRTGDKEDFILSCVKDKNGDFFDSRNAKDNEPKDADANGAYHIGLKGLMLIQKIKESPDLDKKIDMKIDRDDFINYVNDMNE